MLPEVMEFRIKGKQGEHEVASLLSDFANIMTPEQDVGIDFLCELYRDRTNRVLTGEYFCVQAKATEKIADVWKANIDKKTIVFWLNQTYPVFLLLFEKSSQKFFWLSVERNRKDWSEKLSDTYQSIQIAINKENTIQKYADNGRFIEQIKTDLILLGAIHGVPRMIGDGYVRQIPIIWLSETAQDNIKHNIRIGLDHLANDLVLKNNLQGAYEICKMLADFDHSHYDHFLLLARICQQLGRLSEARDNYNVAIGICKDDLNWDKLKTPEQVSIKDIIEEIEQELSELNRIRYSRQ